MTPGQLGGWMLLGESDLCRSLARISQTERRLLLLRSLVTSSLWELGFQWFGVVRFGTLGLEDGFAAHPPFPAKCQLPVLRLFTSARLCTSTSTKEEAAVEVALLGGAAAA